MYTSCWNQCSWNVLDGPFKTASANDPGSHMEGLGGNRLVPSAVDVTVWGTQLLPPNSGVRHPERPVAPGAR